MITGDRLQELYWEHWLNFHGRKEVKLISLGSDEFKDIEGARYFSLSLRQGQ